MARRSQLALSGLSLCGVVILFYYNGGILQRLYSNSIANCEFEISFGLNNLNCTSNFQIYRHTSIYNWTEVASTCDLFFERVRDYNIALSTLRNETLAQRKSAEWKGAKGGATLNVIWGGDDDYLEQLGRESDVQTVALPWLGDRSVNWSSLEDKSNLLLQEYYEWTAHDKLCTWIESPGVIKMYYDVIFNRTCNRYYNMTVKPQSLKPVFLHYKPLGAKSYWPNDGISLPSHFFTSTPPYVFYLHIITDTLITDVGDIYTKTSHIVPYGCQAVRRPKVPANVTSRPVYDEVFVITQYWGNAVFHRMAEIMPRLGGWLEFLRQNPQIKILAPESKGRIAELVRIIGLDPGRLVSAWGRAKVAYVPRASYCGMASVQESQIISSIYQQYVSKVLGALPRNKLILIRRSFSRRFTEHSKIERAIRRLASEYGLEFELFKDNPVPSLTNTMLMFHAAVMVVAPHGAGLSNVFFSQPGTYVVEGVCNLPHVNFCFQRLAVILGHHWHGVPSRGGCERVIDVSATEVEVTARTYLEHYKLSKTNPT